MTIGIVGNYGNNNQGDESILEGILTQLEDLHGVTRNDIIVFSNQPEQTRAKYGVKSVNLYYKNKIAPLTMLVTMAKNRKIIRDLDMLIIGGGGIFMDLYGREAFLFGMYGWLGKLSRTPVVLYGVGAGPILTRTGKVILRSLAHLARLVTVRDPKSKNLLQEIGVTSPVHVIGDPAFQVRQGEPQDKYYTDGTINIGVTAVPYYHASYWPNEDKDKYNAFVTGMARNLDQLLKYEDRAIVNFFATKYPHDIYVTEAIQAEMVYHNRTTICRENLPPEEIVAFSKAQDLVIGTRLHSLILALKTNKPIIAVSYHHKVQDFMDMINCSDSVIQIEDLTHNPGFFKDVYSSMKHNWDETLEAFEQKSLYMKDKASKGMTLIKETFDKREPGKRILVLSNMYPSRHSKTFGIFVKAQVEQLRDQALKVDVIAIDDPRKGKLRLLMKYGKFFLLNALNLAVRGWKYDAVHAHYIFPTGLAALWYKRLFNRRLIVTSHGGDIDQMSKKSGFAQAYTQKILNKADHVITVGEGLKRDVTEKFSVEEDAVSVINMGVNRSVFYPMNKAGAKRKSGLEPDVKHLIFVGNLIEAKGLNDLIDAQKLIDRERSDVRLHLIGEPKDRAYFNAMKERIGTDESIRIHEAMPQTEIAAWMSGADVFVLPSHIEGFGLVALEAMACGLPVVGTDVGGLHDLLAEGAGIKVKPHHPEELAKAITDVLDSAEKRGFMRSNGFLKADKYDQDKLVKKVIELYSIPSQ